MDEDYYADLDKHISLLRKCEYIRDEKEVKKLCDKAKEILSQEGNVIYLNAPITVQKYKNIFNY
jgi:hypothetical protein